ncbi:MAG: transglycosylase SLT domain-containing protein [Bdellovibrionota bacterium]
MSAVSFPRSRLCVMSYMIKRTVIALSLVLLLPLWSSQAEDDVAVKQIRDDAPLIVRRLIAGRAKDKAEAIAASVLNESEKHHFDPLILLSIIETESGFTLKKRGRHGEAGLMQIKPSTARWVSKRIGVPWRGPKTLEDPQTNIRIGAAYLSYLR